MNKRIKELAEQAGAGQHEGYEVLYHTFSPTALQKFFELIVGECANTVTDRCEMRNEQDVKRAEYHAKRIKEHFGVE